MDPKMQATQQTCFFRSQKTEALMFKNESQIKGLCCKKIWRDPQPIKEHLARNNQGGQ